MQIQIGTETCHKNGKLMPQRTIRSGFPANTLMTNWGWFTTITAIIIPKMAGGLVGILL